MRDIRHELEERVRTLELQLGGTDTWFEQRVEQLKKEIEQLKTEQVRKIGELKTELQLVNKVLRFEQQRFGPATQPSVVPLGVSGRLTGT